MIAKLKALCWPIERTELGHYLPIFIVTLLLGIDYHILRNLKYAILITAPGAGAEAIPFVQLWGLVPAALVMTYVLARLGRRFSQAGVFYLSVVGFITFFGVFAFILVPYGEALEPTRLCAWLSSWMPPAMSGFVAIIRYWGLSLFYIAAELWKVSVLAVLFWGYVNSTIEVGQAKRFYGPLMLASSLAGMFGGGVATLFSRVEVLAFFGLSKDQWLSFMMGAVVVIALLAMGVFRWLQKHTSRVRPAHAKTPFSVKGAFKTLVQSKYLLSLGFIVAADYVAFTLTELLWKDQLRLYCPDKLTFCAYTGQVILWASGLSVVASIFLSSSFINKLGWTFSAYVQPCVILLTSLFFYLFVLFQDNPSVITMMGSVSPLAFGCFLGGVHNCLCRVSKVTLLDPTKELAFVPLDAKHQVEGKALIDGIGVHAGRGGGALAQQVLLFAFPTVLAGASISCAIVVGIVLLWLRCVRYVGNRYTGIANEELA